MYQNMIMVCRKISFVITVLFLLLSVGVDAQTGVALPRSVPEVEGVSSEGIVSFLEAVGNSKHELHSFMFLRHGKVIAEGWWNPYQPDLKHSMYSVSKSFTSTAVGFAVSEKRLTVNDKVISFFPDDLPNPVSPYLSELTVKDLLSMAVGQEPDPTATAVVEKNWVKKFLATPLVHKPGTKFLYNTLATYMLSAIVQKVTGEKVIDYLKPRLFTPLGIQGIDWEVGPEGINTGGWGLRLKTEDMAKFGQLYLQKGSWKGRQLLPKEWIAEATSSQIEQPAQWIAPGTKKDSSDWLQGYCYQFWRCRHDAFRADGAFGQFIIVMPDEDAVIVVTAETSDMQDEINLIWKNLLPALHKEKLPLNKNMAATLKQKLAALALPPPAKSLASPIVTRISAAPFTIEPNDMHIENIAFQFKGHVCHVTLKTDAAVYTQALGLGTWEVGETNRRGPYLLSGAQANFVGLPPSKVAGSYRWNDENTLELVLRYVESPHTETIICHFDQTKISLDVHKSFDPANKTLTLKGELSPGQQKAVR